MCKKMILCIKIIKKEKKEKYFLKNSLKKKRQEKREEVKRKKKLFGQFLCCLVAERGNGYSPAAMWQRRNRDLIDAYVAV